MTGFNYFVASYLQTFESARAFYVSKSFQKPASEVRLVKTGFTDKRIAGYTFFHSSSQKT